MSDHATIFGLTMLGLGAVAAALAFVISAEEDIHERFYGNSAESGFNPKNRDDGPDQQV